MYYYIFDAPTGPNDYQRSAQIKDRLTSLGIAGEMASPMPGKSVQDLVKNAIAKRYSTIVAVGNIALINQVAQAIEPHDVVLGIIPLHDQPDLCELIGASTWEAAAEQLKRRRWQPIRLGLIENVGCFLTPATVEVPHNEWLHLKTPQFDAKQSGGLLKVMTTRSEDEGHLSVEILFPSNDKPSFLGKIFKRTGVEVNRESKFTTKSVHVATEKPLSILVAGEIVGQTPCRFTTQAKPLRLIVARGTAQA